MDVIRAVGALADPVRREVYEHVADQHDAVGREQVAEALDLPAHSVRFHLERLVEEGLLVTESRRLTGRSGPGAGRPAKLYRRAEAQVAVSLPPRSYDLAGSVLAAAVAASLAGERLTDALEREARARGRTTGASYDGRGSDVERARDLLAAEGFEPVVEGPDLSLRNCPFDALAREQPELVCGMNVHFVGGVLDGLGCDGLEARLQPDPDRCCVRVRHDQHRGQRRRRGA